MDTKKKILSELVKKLKIFSETYVSDKPPENYKKSKSNEPKKNSQRKTDSHKKHKRRFTTNFKKMKKIKLNDINQPKHNHRLSHNINIKLTNDLTKQFYHKNSYKSQDKKIKINLVSLKFKIADDFNEKNSNQFLNEKDEYLREVILTDEIKEEVPIYFYAKNENENLYKLSSIKKDKVNENLNSIQINKKIIEDDSGSSLTKLIKEIK